MLKKIMLFTFVLTVANVVIAAEQGSQNPPKPESMADYCKKHTC